MSEIFAKLNVSASVVADYSCCLTNDISVCHQGMHSWNTLELSWSALCMCAVLHNHASLMPAADELRQIR